MGLDPRTPVVLAGDGDGDAVGGADCGEAGVRMSEWKPISTASAHLQRRAELFVEALQQPESLGDWTFMAFADEDGSIAVIYYFQETKRVVWSRLTIPLHSVDA